MVPLLKISTANQQYPSGKEKDLVSVFVCFPSRALIWDSGSLVKTKKPTGLLELLLQWDNTWIHNLLSLIIYYRGKAFPICFSLYSIASRPLIAQGNVASLPGISESRVCICY